MQWFINEFKAYKAEVEKRFVALETMPAETGLTERVTKLEGELRMMKARMAKKGAGQPD